MTGGREGDRPPDGPEDRVPGPSTDWLADYDEALRLGNDLPDTASGWKGPESGQEREQLRCLLHLLDQALRPSNPGLRRGLAPGDRVDGGEADRVRGPGEVGDIPPLGRFRVDRELGRGGFGVVYLAYDPEMDRRIALKLPRPDALVTPDVRRRFLREARAAARLDHPNLVPVFEAGQVGPVCYIASALCEGPSLGRWLASGNAPVEPRRAARLALAIALALALALEHMHARELLHCDLKPGNVLLDLPDDPTADPVPRVTDFGLARLSEVPTGDSTAMRPWGTPPYMAPEQIEQRREAIGPATDVYAVGAILYELLAGRPPHGGASVWELVRSAVSEPPTPPSQHRRSIPRDLEAIALRCLEKSPERRYATAAELADDLDRFLGRRPTRARPLGPARRAARWALRHPAAAVTIGMGAVTLASSLAAALTLARSNRELERANAVAARALEAERQHGYVAALALSQEDAGQGRIGPAQQRMLGFMPLEGEPDRRDFA